MVKELRITINDTKFSFNIYLKEYIKIMSTNLEVKIIELLEQKLTHALDQVDKLTQEKVLTEWSSINPSQQCPYVTNLMNKLHLDLVKGCREKGNVAKEVVITTLNQFHMHLTTKLADEIIVKVKNLLPENNLITLVEKTPEVYSRASAPVNKFNLEAYSLELSLITVSVINETRQSVDNIKTAINQIMLQKEIDTPLKIAWWKYVLKIIWYFIKSIGNWIFGILASIIVAIIIYRLGIG